MAIKILYRPCYVAVDLIFCSEGKQLLDLALFFQLLVFFFELAASCC